MNRRRLNLSRQPDPITWNSKRGSMKLTVKTDRNTLYLSADGNYQEQALHSFPCQPVILDLAMMPAAATS